MALGNGLVYQRACSFDRLNESLGDISLEAIEEQIGILESHVIITRPTRRSVELSRRFSVNAQNYLVNICGYTVGQSPQLGALYYT